jgi:hypothetical protein
MGNTPAGSKTLKWRSFGTNHKRVRAVERPYCSAGGKTLKGNPKCGTGMKQGQQIGRMKTLRA